MKAVPDLHTGQHIAVCRQRSLPFALLEPQPAVPKKAGQLLAFRGPRAGRNQHRVPLLRDVKVVAVKPASRYAGQRGEGMQLVIGGVADHVRPQPSMRGPAWW